VLVTEATAGGAAERAGLRDGDLIIGFRPDEILEKFRLNTPRRMEVAKRDVRLSGAMIEIDEDTGKATRIIRISERLED